eukprot:CAMPEP_0173131344 /NCGR_PEP_ID=MMETSP1102-20130122/60578_1 /TAXON_ID=49646 /ORGANISM="Geminigera sp., Strain Caron Lab Isolate" /LENGTH=45 /DNA_ID= /DNA_START= /DNA_END= /DNA_ORIENTATION=
MCVRARDVLVDSMDDRKRKKESNDAEKPIKKPKKKDEREKNRGDL